MTEEQQKKGLSPWAWVAIGCGGLILIAFLMMSAGLWWGAKKIKDVAEDFGDDPVRSAAEMMVKMNPELELVESDADEGTITVRVKETGEVATFDYSEIEEGKLSFESSEGTMTFDATGADEAGVVTIESEEGTARWSAGQPSGETPDWFPDYPEASARQTVYTSEMEGTASGAFSFETPDPPSEVFDYYRKKLEAAGFQVQENTMSEGGEVKGGLLIATLEEDKRSAQVSIAREDATTRVSVFYSDAP